jgi:hypothetical protein
MQGQAIVAGKLLILYRGYLNVCVQVVTFFPLPNEWLQNNYIINNKILF